jgi:ADP-ribosyl-[dinitrogen reductase] hydrolase
MPSDHAREPDAGSSRHGAGPGESAWDRARGLAAAGRLKVCWHAGLDTAPPPMPPGIDLADKVEGMLLGLAIGDALGNTSESLNPDTRRASMGWIAHYLPNPRAGGRAVGVPSDDTQMAFWTLEQMLAGGGLDPAALAAIFCEREIYGMGRTVHGFRQNMAAGAGWAGSGVPSAGNGALMRIVPVLLPYLKSPHRNLWADTLLAAHLTHDDLLSNSSCVALVHLLWQVLAMQAPPARHWWVDTWLAASEPLTQGRADGNFAPRRAHPPGFRGTMAQMVRQHVAPALEQGLGVAEAGAIWHSGAYLLETVPSVLYVLARHGHDPVDAILQAVNHTRDNDTCAAIVGAAVGALHGAARLPVEWVESLLGRTGADDDGKVFELLAAAGSTYGYGVSPRVRQRAERQGA